MKIAILGAGLCGRLLAIRLLDLGVSICLIEKDFSGQHSCAYQAAGMVAPISELVCGEPLLAKLGAFGLQMWSYYSEKLEHAIDFVQSSTIWLSQADEKEVLMHYLATLKSHTNLQWVNKSYLQEILLCHLKCAGGIKIDNEAYLNPRQFFKYSSAYLKEACDLIVLETSQNETYLEHFDWVIDTRGLGAFESLKTLRGVKGELLRLKIQSHLKQMIRFFTRHGIYYLKPEGEQQYLLGGTEIETNEGGLITVENYLYLLATLSNFLPEFRQAELIGCQVGLRPTLSSGLPQLKIVNNIISLNGFYRHGFLISPFFIEWAIYLMDLRSVDPSLILTLEDRKRLCNAI
ncbi:MAG: FAD-dependent oxidoreductase [Gammaproteobacteria bacterium]